MTKCCGMRTQGCALPDIINLQELPNKARVIQPSRMRDDRSQSAGRFSGVNRSLSVESTFVCGPRFAAGGIWPKDEAPDARVPSAHEMKQAEPRRVGRLLQAPTERAYHAPVPAAIGRLFKGDNGDGHCQRRLLMRGGGSADCARPDLASRPDRQLGRSSSARATSNK